jgi:hypothetical protein
MFELDEDRLVLITTTIPPHMLDDQGEPLFHVDLPLKFIVVNPKDKTTIITTFFNSVLQRRK